MRYVFLTTFAFSFVSSLLLAEDPKAISLFNGKDLSGWEPYIWDRFAKDRDTKTPSSDVWTVDERTLICRGRPVGYLRSKNLYKDYSLTLEWRWPEGSNGGNSGVLVHTSTPKSLGLWPKSIEVQLYKFNAGDFWVIGTDLDVENEEERKKGRRHLNLTNDSEFEIGKWNKMEVTCKGNEIVVKVNGDLVNHATNCTVSSGAICLQSEGAEIHFRNISLTPLK